MPKCKYCNATIIFIEINETKKMPCEARITEVWRDPFGDTKAISPFGEVFRCDTKFSAFVKSEQAYIAHWQNCPGADSARSPKNRRKRA